MRKETGKRMHIPADELIIDDLNNQEDYSLSDAMPDYADRQDKFFSPNDSSDKIDLLKNNWEE